MSYEIRYSSVSIEQLRRLRAFDRTAILGAVEKFLMKTPTRVSKTTLKRLREPAPTQYRLRVGEYRIFYDVEGEVVSIIQVLSKEDSIRFLGGPT